VTSTPSFSGPEVPLAELSGDQLRARVARARLYLIEMKPAPGWDEATSSPDRRVLRDHLAYLYKLEAEGRLFGCGPVDFEPGAPVEGLGIVAAASREEAERIAAEEPLHKAGARINSVRGHTMNEGVACYVGRALAKRAEARPDTFDPDISGVKLSLQELMARTARASLFLIRMEPTGKRRPPEEAGVVGHSHFVWLRENEMAAKLLSCGPTEPLNDLAGGSGLAVVAAASREEAERIAAAEPNNVAGYRTLTVGSWLLNEGLAAPIGKALAELNALG
jgi:uncharacterized protein